MKQSCQFSNGQWCGKLHDFKSPDRDLCQAAFIHIVTDDAVGPRPWETHLYLPTHGGARPNAGRKPTATDRPGQVLIDPADLPLLDELRGALSRKSFVSELIRKAASH